MPLHLYLMDAHASISHPLFSVSGMLLYGLGLIAEPMVCLTTKHKGLIRANQTVLGRCGLQLNIYIRRALVKWELPSCVWDENEDVRGWFTNPGLAKRCE